MNWRLKSTNNSDSNSQQRQQHLIIIDLRYFTTANNQQAEATQILNYYLIFYRIQVGTQTHLNTHISYNKERRRTTATRRLHWNIRSFDEERRRYRFQLHIYWIGVYCDGPHISPNRKQAAARMAMAAVCRWIDRRMIVQTPKEQTNDTHTNINDDDEK